MFNVVHGLTNEQNVRVIASVHEALNDGGRLYILDQVKGRTDVRLLLRSCR